MTQEVCCRVCVFTRHLCVELYFHRQDVCMFQTPFLCGPEGFGSVWVEVRELEYVCMMCVCRVMENWWYMKDGDSQMGSREYKGKKVLRVYRVCVRTHDVAYIPADNWTR